MELRIDLLKKKV